MQVQLVDVVAQVTGQDGAVLRSRRARITPAAAGLPDGYGIRRVPGLRREEVARLAGVSGDESAIERPA